MGVIGRLSRLSRQYEHAIRLNLVAFDLRSDEFDVLATLRRSGKPFKLNPRDLLESMMVSSATMTHRLDKLEARGLVAREADPNDRRGVVAKLTPNGRRLIDRALEAHVRLEDNFLEPLGQEDRDQLTVLLRRLAQADMSNS